MTAFSACAAKICDALTAKQFVVVELFLNAERNAGDGCSSWMQMPTSFRLAAAGVLPDANVDATKLSDSIRRVILY